MARKLMGHEVSDEMFRKANGVFSRGGKAFVCLPEGRAGGSCDNCRGWGHFILQHVTGGPFDSPPHGGKTGTATTIDGSWYMVQNEQFNCPECMGTGKTPARQPQQHEPVRF